MTYLLNLALLLILLSGCQVKSASSGGLISGNSPVTNSFTVTTPSAGSYKESDHLNFTLTHPFNVVVTGTPRLVLTIDGNTRYADYVSGSGSRNLVFRYVVQTGLNDSDGISVASSIDLNGGTLTFNDTLEASTSLSVGSTASVKIDTVIPQITSTFFGVPKIYKLGQKFFVTVEYDENVVVTGLPQIQFDLDGVTKNATYASGSGTSVISFSYTVVTLDKDLDGLNLLSTNLNGGTIKDTAGNATPFIIAPVAMAGIFVHDVPTLITSITASADKVYLLSETISLTAVFSRTVTVTGSPRIAINVGGTTVYAVYQSGSGTASLVFDYTISVGHLDTNGISVGNVIDLNGGALIDSQADPVLSVTFNTPSTPLVKVDGDSPSIVSVTPPTNATYLIDQPMNFSVIFSDVVTVTGTPTLDFIIGISTVEAAYISGSGSNTLIFRYTPVVNDLDLNGIAMDVINLGSGAINDGNGNSTNVTLPTVNTSSIFIQGVLPNIVSVTAPPDAVYLVGNQMNFSVNFDRAVTVTGVPSLNFATTDGVKSAIYISGSGTSTLVFRYTVISNNYDYDGIALSSPVILNAGTIKDTNNYAAELVFTPPITINVLVDASPALVSSVTIPSSRAYGEGELLNFIVIFTKNVTITGTPRLTINLDGATVYANYQSGSGTKNIVFRKTIVASEVDSDGISTSSSIDLNGGTIKDINTINAVLTFATLNTSGILVDSLGPQITLITPPSNNTYVTGQNLTFVVDYSEDVTVTGGPRLALNIGGTTRHANYLSGSGSGTLVFRHTVLSNDLDLDGISVTAAVDLNGGMIQDAMTNNSGLVLTPPILTSVLVDAVLPTILSVTAPANAVYANPGAINFTVNFSKAITVTGTPRIHLDVLGTTLYATYLSGSGTASLLFRYSPTTSHFDLDGIALLNSNDIDLSGGTLKDSLNNNAAVGIGAIDLSKVYVSHPGLGAWFDVSDATKVVTAFVNPNYQTSNLDDKSGNARHASQVTAANRPYYLSSGFGSQNKPFLQNASTDFLGMVSNVANVKQIIMVFKTPPTIAASAIFASTSTSIMGIALGGTGRLAFNTAAQWKINGGALTGPAAIVSANNDLVPSTCYVASGVFTTPQSPTVQRLGSPLFLGQFVEVLVYTSAVTLTNADLTVIHNALNAKYGCY